MKTKLEVGKEYWLSGQKISRGIYLGESNSGNFDFRITLGSKYTKPLGELDEMTSNLSVYSEYIPGKPWSFTTPIAMKCTEEQFNGIEDKLFDMGYTPSFIYFVSSDSYLVSGYKDDSTLITNVSFKSMIESKLNRIIFTSFNPDLFLALAAMTDKEDGIKGEYFKCVDTDDTAFGSLYIKTKENFSEMFRLDSKELVETGFDCANSSEFRKATAQEIIEHFEKKEFVLPERWCVKIGDLNTNDIILKWRHENSKYKYYSGSKGYINYDGFFTKEPLYTEITFDQFKKYVLKETAQSCPETPVVGSIEYIVNVEFDAEKAAEDLFEKIVELGKSHQPEFKFAWEPCKEKIEKFENFLGSFDPFINIKNIDKTVIPIHPTKQATLFDDRVEITDWKPKDGDFVFYVAYWNNEFRYTNTFYNDDFKKEFKNGFIKRSESEAKQLVEKLKQAML